MLTGSQCRLDTLSYPSGRSAHQMVFGSTPAALFGRGVRDEDLMFAQETSLLGQATQQWKLRGMPQEAALVGMANSKWRRINDRVTARTSEGGIQRFLANLLIGKGRLGAATRRRFCILM